MSKQKVVIIGSGLGGLSCGYILQKNRYKVTVLEQGAQIGGCLQCFMREGAKFETGMHFIGSAAPGQTMSHVMNYLSLSSITLNPLERTAYNTVCLGSESFRFANGNEEFIAQMAAYFPHQKDALKRYIDIINSIASASTLKSLASQERDLAANTEYQTRSINNVLDEIFSDELLKNVLVGDLPLYAAERDKTPFSQHAFIMDFYNQSAYRIVGGSDAVAKSLSESIRSMGGEVLNRKKAVRIRCNETRATAVETEDECLYDADYVISSIHPNRLLEILDSKLIRPAFRSRINSIPQTAGSFAVYVRFKEKAMPYMNTNYFGYDGSTPWGCEDYTESSWTKGFLYMHMCHEKNPVWARSGVVLTYMNMADVQQWKGLGIGHRGEDYENFKRNRAARLIRQVDRQIPGFAASIESFYTSTPLTYLDYTGTENGSLYGVAKDIHLGQAGRVPYRLKVPNVFLAGQNVNSHGMMGVIVGSLVTCSELVDAGLLYKQLEEADK